MRPYRRQLVVVLIATLVRPILNTAKVWLLKLVIDNVIRQGQMDVLAWVSAGYLGIAIGKGFSSFVDDYLGGWVGTRVVRDLRAALYDRLQSLSLRFYHGQRLGDMLTRLISDIGAIEDLLVSGIVDLLARTLTILLFVGMLFYLNSSLALIALVVTPALALTSVGYARRMRTAQSAIRERLSALTSRAEEGLSAIALVKAFAREGFEQGRFVEAATASSDARLKGLRVQALFTPAVELMSTVGTVLVVWLGSEQVMSGQFTLGGLVIFLGYMGSLYTPIQGLSHQGAGIQRAFVGAGRVAEILDASPDVRERRHHPDLPSIGGLVEFRDVSFGYTPDRLVLDGFNLSIHPGEMVALVGASGAGKTTVVSLLLSYYDVQGGAMEIDGHDLRCYNPSSVRRQIAAVLQEPMLFQATIRENLRYGWLDATDAEIEEAARAACAEGFIQNLPDGYDTLLGPRGVGLSGGQRQRLAIARALLKDAPVMILDEATSALDAATEANVLCAVRERMAGCSALVVAHRLSTVRYADRIAVLSEGRIAELGMHEELLGLGGLYASFCATQARA
ncbi:MAG: ABC transporter ATP-binding protein [Chloroflexi bacterium]|nr:ABC transporter ATP-binding protein [Chloroflexota bacterium]